jgi:hypothetical protein
LPSRSVESAGRIALSIKQPWATLVVHGLKTIEVRTWPTRRTGWIHIHTGRAAETAVEAWRQVPPHLQAEARKSGGIVGRVRLLGCKRYLLPEEFAADANRHLVPTAWHTPKMHGFVCADAEPLPFEPCRGALLFFTP